MVKTDGVVLILLTALLIPLLMMQIIYVMDVAQYSPLGVTLQLKLVLLNVLFIV